MRVRNAALTFLFLLPILFSVRLVAQYDQNDPPASIARIGYLDGNVSLQAAGTDEWSQAPINYPMVGGDRIYTGPGSRAVVQLEGAELRVWQATDVTLTNLTDNFEQLGLAQGAMRLRVFQMEPGSQIEVDTPNGAVIVESPGDYRIEAFPQGGGQNGDQAASSILTVNTGNAQVTGPNINLPLSGGYAVGLFGNNPVELQYIDVPDYDDLDYWSISLDQRLRNSVTARYVSPQMVGYGDLDANGTWEPQSEYGPVWYPNNMPYGWQPYSLGHWAYVQPWGYTWVDDQPWGFAPFHYGRWSQINGRWGWFPGPPSVRPVYSPALVAFVGGGPGGGGLSIDLHIGGGGGVGISAWFPIGVGEPYVPWYRCSPSYARQVNVSNVNVAAIRNTTVVNNYNTYITKTTINNTTINNTTVNDTTVNNFNYANRAAVTAVPASAMASGGSVARQAVRLTPEQQQQIAKAPISVRPTAPAPVSPHPSLMAAANVSRPAARPTLMTPAGPAKAVASPVKARPVVLSQLPAPKVVPKNAPPPAAAPKPIQQNRVNQPVVMSQPVRPVAPVAAAKPATQPAQPVRQAPASENTRPAAPIARPATPAVEARPEPEKPATVTRPTPQSQPVEGAPAAKPAPVVRPAAPATEPARPAPPPAARQPAVRPAPAEAAPVVRPASPQRETPATQKPAAPAAPAPKPGSQPNGKPLPKPDPKDKPAPKEKPKPDTPN